MSRGSLVMNYSWVKTAPVVITFFTVVSDQHSPAISLQAVEDRIQSMSGSVHMRECTWDYFHTQI